jgi:hypothetical protein
VNVQAFHARFLFLAVRFGSATAGLQSAEHEAPAAAQQFSVKYPTSKFIAAKSAA